MTDCVSMFLLKKTHLKKMFADLSTVLSWFQIFFLTQECEQHKSSKTNKCTDVILRTLYLKKPHHFCLFSPSVFTPRVCWSSCRRGFPESASETHHTRHTLKSERIAAIWTSSHSHWPACFRPRAPWPTWFCSGRPSACFPLCSRQPRAQTTWSSLISVQSNALASAWHHLSVTLTFSPVSVSMSASCPMVKALVRTLAPVVTVTLKWSPFCSISETLLMSLPFSIKSSGRPEEAFRGETHWWI